MLGGKIQKRRGRAVSAGFLISTLCAAMVVLAGLAPAAAEAGTTATPVGVVGPFALSVPQNGDDPIVAYDPVSGTTFVAWSDPQDSDNSGGVELCIMPANQSSTCEGGGPVLLTVNAAENPAITGDNTISLGGLTVLPNGEVVVIGTPVENSSIAWASPADGSAFLTSGQGLQNGGDFISEVSLFYTFNNAVPLGNTDVGLLDDYGDQFSDSPFAGPETPLIPTVGDNDSNSNQGNGGLFPRKALEIDGSEIASEPTPAPAPAGTWTVVGVGDNYAGPNNTLPGCINSSGTGYGVSVGPVDGASRASGTLNGNGIPGYGLLACAAANPAIAGGGKDGIGVLENEGSGIDGAGSTYTLDYRAFVATATGGSFNSPAVVLAKMTDYASDLDVVDDSGTGVYALWDEDGEHIAYSPNGGATWDAPVLVPEVGGDQNPGDPTIAGVANGTVLLAFDDNLGTGDRTYMELINAAPITVPTSTTTTGSSITITVSCSAACTVTITIEIPSASASAASAGHKKKAKGPIKLATRKFSLTKGGKDKLKLNLTSIGRSLLRKDHDKLKTTLLLTSNTSRGLLTTKSGLKITPKKR
jgi:hypothetical protein